MRLDSGPDGTSALFSDDDKYRFVLERRVQALPPNVVFPSHGMASGGRLVACGLNPSTADAFQDDPTIRRELGFARRWGCTTFVKVNAYAWRDTDPLGMWRALKAGHDVSGGPDNYDAIRCHLTMLKRDGGIALACWGNHAKPDRVRELWLLAASVGVVWQCIGTNKGGSPKHPLYARSDSILRPWVRS